MELMKNDGYDITKFGLYATGGGNQLYFLEEDLFNIERIEKIINLLK
jgi:hypothetical protein